MFDGEGIGKKRWVERLCKLSKGILDIPFGKPNLLMENCVFSLPSNSFFKNVRTYQHNTTCFYQEHAAVFKDNIINNT
jgi:hypothetical protein